MSGSRSLAFLPRVALVGLPGSGKSVAGRLLAEALACPFLDTDALVEREGEGSVPEIIRSEGESAFRDLERAVLAEAARAPAPLVLATGGGIVEMEENRKVLKDGFFVVWLRVELEVLLGRLGPAAGRPLLAGDVRGLLEALAARREPLYRDSADHIVEIESGSSPEGVAAGIREAVLGLSD